MCKSEMPWTLIPRAAVSPSQIIAAIAVLMAIPVMPQSASRPSEERDCIASTGCHIFSLRPGTFSLPCLEGKEVLRNELGSIVLIAEDELNRRATQKAAIRINRALLAPKTVKTYLAIDPNGQVLCADPTESAGVLRDIAMKAVRKWRFQPVLHETRPVYAMGQMEIGVEYR